MTDVAIVGAGPAGTSLALQLARSGCDVTILERRVFPRTKVCGEYLAGGARSALSDLSIEDRALRGAHPIRSISLSAFGSEPVRLRLPSPGAVSLERAVLDSRLLEAALAAGASLKQGSFMRSSERSLSNRARKTGRSSSNGLVDVVYRDEHGAERSLSARVLVGADGAWSAVAQRNGMAKPGAGGRWAVGGHLEGQTDSDELEMYVGPGGYYARNPLSATVVNSMLVLPRPAQASEAEAAVATITSGRRRFEADALQRRVAIGPLRYAAEHLCARRTILTGDAAGLLDPFTGQGVSCALRLSFSAAETIAGLLAGGRPERLAARYAAEWRRAVGMRKVLSFLIDALMRNGALRRRAHAKVRQDPSIAEAMLAAISGYAPIGAALSPGLLWRLLA
ncbi:MAG: hypothetical protein DLM53_04675 [Candidatus Eremiobacter antarcticus]|nr:NAD(P)/FAD-dependent oxidoreductase [Candidatus Eremiobacteraeota bacterium]MBC5807922.1 NAD(P)/FAD-dependent oxidoreductase [Candidatus Eremiobacteraeota bacterium]PZR62709.1 MAG: hypothetical protein DLM53_04675 [Candidatus Eremiobacter sp. RRmetagenome_bin22]